MGTVTRHENGCQRYERETFGPSEEYLKQIPLDESMLQRFQSVEAMQYLDKGKLRAFSLPEFLIDFNNKLFNLGILPELYSYEGSYVPHVGWNKLYNDVDVIFHVGESSLLDYAQQTLEGLLKEKKWEGLQIIKGVQPKGVPLVGFTLSTIPPLDITLVKGSKELPFSCVSSADCFRLVCVQNEWVLITVDGYDMTRAKELLDRQRFEVIPQENALEIHNGLLRYCKLLNKGLLPEQEGIEALFCEGLSKKFPSYDAAALQRFQGAVLHMIESLDEVQQQAFLFTLESVLIRSSIDGKGNYLIGFHEKMKDKGDFFLKFWKEGSTPIYLKRDLQRPPRYLLAAKEGYVFMEAPPEVLEWLFSKHSLQSTNQAFELLPHLENRCSIDLLEMAVREGAQYDKKKEAFKLLRRQITRFFSLGKEKLFPLIEPFSDFPYAQLLRSILQEDWESYIGAIEKGLEYKKPEQEHLLALTGMPFVFGEDLIEALLTAQEPRWQPVGLKKASLERVIRYIEESEIPQECLSVLEDRLISALEDKEIASLFPSIEAIGSVDFYIRILEKIQQKNSVPFQSLRHLLLSVGLPIIEGLLDQNTQESVSLVFTMLEKEMYSAESYEKAIHKAKQLGMKKEAFACFRSHINKLYSLGKPQLRALYQDFPSEPYLKLLKCLVEEDWSGYVHAIDTGTIYDPSEQEKLLTLVGAPLVFKENLVKTLLASEDPRWIELGLKRASSEQVMDFAGHREVPKGMKSLVQEKLLAMLFPDPEVAKNIFINMKEDPQLQPFVYRAISRALQEDKLTLAIELYKRAKMPVMDVLRLGFQAQSKTGCKFCLQIYDQATLAEKEKIALYAIENNLIVEVLALLEEMDSPKWFAQIIERMDFPSMFFSMGQLQLCQFLLPRLQNFKAVIKAMTLLISFNRQQSVMDYFWKNVNFFKKQSPVEKRQLLHLLVEDRDIAHFLEAYEEDTFRYEKYFQEIKTLPADYLKRNRQEKLFQLVGSSLEHMQLLHDSDEVFLDKIASCEDSFLKQRSFRDLVVNRFEKIYSHSLEKCVNAYIKLKNFLSRDYADPLFRVAQGESQKAILLQILFEQKEGKKLDADEIKNFFDQLNAYRQQDSSLEAIIVSLIRKGVLNKWHFSKEVLFAAIRLLSGCKHKKRAEASWVVIRKAIYKHLKREVLVCIEEQKKMFCELSSKNFLELMKAVPVEMPIEIFLDKITHEDSLEIKIKLFFSLFSEIKKSSCFFQVAPLFLEKIAQENDIIVPLYLLSLETFIQTANFPLLIRCLDIFNEERQKDTFSREEQQQVISTFLKLDLGDFSLWPLGDLILTQAFQVDYKQKDLEVFIARYWFTFKSAELFRLELGTEFINKIVILCERQIREYKEISDEVLNATMSPKKIPKMSPLNLSLHQNFRLIPIDVALKKEKAEFELMNFLNFLRLLEYPPRFDVNDFRIVLLKISVVTALQKPLLWEPDIEKALDERWRPLESPIPKIAISEMTKMYIENLWISSQQEGMARCKQLLLLGIKGGALLEDKISELFFTLYPLDRLEKESFAQEFVDTCSACTGGITLAQKTLLQGIQNELFTSQTVGMMFTRLCVLDPPSSVDFTKKFEEACKGKYDWGYLDKQK